MTSSVKLVTDFHDLDKNIDFLENDKQMEILDQDRIIDFEEHDKPLDYDHHITTKDIDCLKEAFALFDCDRDGVITVEELGKVKSMNSLIISKGDNSRSVHTFIHNKFVGVLHSNNIEVLEVIDAFNGLRLQRGAYEP